MNLTVEQIQSVIKDKFLPGLVVPEHTSDGHFYRETVQNVVYPSVTTKAGILDAPHLKKYAARLAVEHLDKNWDNITPENKESFYHAAIMAHQDVLEDAGGVGTEGHHVIEKYLVDWMRSGKRPNDITKFISGEDVRLHAITRSAQKFCIDFNVVPIASELLVVSHKFRFAGTLDSLMMVARPIKKGNGSCDNQPGMFGEERKPHEFYGSANPLRWNEMNCNHCGLQVVLEFALVDWKTSNSIDKVEYAMQVSAYNRALWEMTGGKDGGLRVKHIFIVRLDKEFAKYQVMKVVHYPSAFRAFAHCSKVWDWLNDGTEKLTPLIQKERISLSMI